MTATTLEQKALTSVCYDGHVHRTYWPNPSQRAFRYAQEDQAGMHRDTVRAYLYSKRLNRLPRVVDEVAA